MPDDQAQEKTANFGKLIREVYFPTFVYFKDLPNGKDINETIKPHIYNWRAETSYCA